MRPTAHAFCSGVSQRSPSTPGVFWPVGSLTRWTAKARAAHAWTNRSRRRLPWRHAPAGTAWTRRRGRDRTCREQAAQLLRCHVLLARPEDACRARRPMVNCASGDGVPRRARPVTPAGSQPPVGGGHACPPLGPMTGPPSLPPASLPGSASPRACAWATPGAYAWHHSGARVRLPTCRTRHSWGEGASGHRGRPPVRRPTVKIHRT
jgi:hypothetical protein